ncbi:DUF3239 domain-containing protein [Hymenobacter lapidiphilus]|uniref:DUF3239 domain-containing protein n=1 Tax=Hymenobacter sp. CCM 8763 TaxID=2303334 RepID=UPI000E343580|nr:DUF3239 domain-containing protein [Hymenobacter sp. CCM 8763]RFP63920.1 DUF3239 domain-containing protein [Hymenobacter sp. CCM 8763]
MERQIGEPGEFLGGSMASRAANIRPDMKKVRQLDVPHRTYRKYLWVSMGAAATLLALAVLLYSLDYTNVAMGGVVVGLTMISVGWSFRKMLTGDAYRNGLLVPGIITGLNALQLSVVAEVQNGDGPNPRGIVWGVNQITVPALSMHPEQLGEQVPCVVLFGADSDGIYIDYEPRPLSWGTNEPAVINSAHSSIDAEEWELAALMAERATTIPGDRTLTFFNEELQYVPHIPES